MPTAICKRNTYVHNYRFLPICRPSSGRTREAKRWAHDKGWLKSGRLEIRCATSHDLAQMGWVDPTRNYLLIVVRSISYIFVDKLYSEGLKQDSDSTLHSKRAVDLFNYKIARSVSKNVSYSCETSHYIDGSSEESYIPDENTLPIIRRITRWAEKTVKLEAIKFCPLKQPEQASVEGNIHI